MLCLYCRPGLETTRHQEAFVKRNFIAAAVISLEAVSTLAVFAAENEGGHLDCVTIDGDYGAGT
jgi:hypothetical protein